MTVKDELEIENATELIIDRYGIYRVAWELPKEIETSNTPHARAARYYQQHATASRDIHTHIIDERR